MILRVILGKPASWVMLKDVDNNGETTSWERTSQGFLKLFFLDLKGEEMLKDQSWNSQTNFESQNRSWKVQSLFVQKRSPCGALMVNNRRYLWSNMLLFLEPEFNDDKRDSLFVSCSALFFMCQLRNGNAMLLLTFLWSLLKTPVKFNRLYT
jgi:hypothetical protein